MESNCYHQSSFISKIETLLNQQCSITISPIEPLTRVKTHNEFTQTMKEYNSITKPEPSPLINRERASQAPHLYHNYIKHNNASEQHKFPLLKNEMSMYEHGVSDDNLDFIAETEDQTRASKAYLHALPGGERVETMKRINPMTGEEQLVKRITASFDEEVVSSRNERFALRNKGGELHAQMHQLPRFTLDSRAQLNLKKEHQLQDLLTSPMNALAKAKEVCVMLQDFYDNKLALQSRCGEEVMMLLSQVSLQLRLEGKTSSSLQLSLPSSSFASSLTSSLPLSEKEKHPKININITCTYKDISSVPFLQEMRQLYKHLKYCFIAPTPLMMEHLMITLGAVQSRNRKVFQIAERLFLDADKYVFLPTRTTYAAFFNICRVNEHMTEAIARMRDAVLKLHIALDAAMAESLLTGLNDLGYVEEAVSLLARCDHIPMTTPLLNASLETLLLSEQPQACFAAFRAVAAQAQLSLNADTYTLLLLACEQSGNWHEVTFVLSDMQRRRVRGNTQTLNLLLKGLMTEKLNDYAIQLYNTMHRKHVEVWPALQGGVKMLQDSKQTGRWNKNYKLGSSKSFSNTNSSSSSSSSNKPTITGLTYKQQLRRRNGKPAL